MARIAPLATNGDALPAAVKAAFEQHVRDHHARITNMKATMAHSLPTFEVYMQWYVLYEAVVRVTGKRLADLYAWAVSLATECPLCTTFFRKIIIDAGEDPEQLELSISESALLAFGGAIGKQQGHISDEVYAPVAALYSTEELVLLTGFAGQMIATNVFNNVIETTIDTYLDAYLKPA